MSWSSLLKALCKASRVSGTSPGLKTEWERERVRIGWKQRQATTLCWQNNSQASVDVGMRLQGTGEDATKSNSKYWQKLRNRQKMLYYLILTLLDLLTLASRFAGYWSIDSEPLCWSSRWGVCATVRWDWGLCQLPRLPQARTENREAAKTLLCSKTTFHLGPGKEGERWKCQFLWKKNATKYIQKKHRILCRFKVTEIQHLASLHSKTLKEVDDMVYTSTCVTVND